MTVRLEEALAELASAEEFLEYFGISFDPQVVQVNRLHILQRFHDYLKSEPLPDSESERRNAYVLALTRAYADFVRSDARTEKVFKVFKQAAGETSIPLTAIGGRSGT